MTNTDKDTASFFKNGTTEQFDYCFKLYPQVLKLKAEKRSKKPQELIRLDQWYQNELPKLIKARGKDAHIVYDELVQTMKWKQTRGKFYPQLSYLVKVNTPRAVMQETKKAFRKLPNLEQAITALSNLKGVGTTMASALLAAASPDSAPFMADECLMAIPEIEGIDYTTKEYLNFVQHIQSTVERLNMEGGDGVEKPLWSPHRVELALWAHYVANDLSPELLEKMPHGTNGGINPIKANGTTATVHNDTNDDTNDDDNALGAHPAANNVTTTDVETENENTNPTAQDGDSNFISNDSSQEPIIDENTTQTTVTSTTEDGEADADADADGDAEADAEDAATPLASDSESNIESPLKNTIQSNKTVYPTTVEEVVVVNSSSTTVAANGNGAVLPPSASEDGESSSCLRPESEYEDESSNSNGHGRTTNPIPDRCAVMTRHNDISATNTDNDSTLSSAGGNSANNTAATASAAAAPAVVAATNVIASSPNATAATTMTTIAVGQKRAHNCSDELTVEDANNTSITTTTTTTISEPEAKKIRND